MGAPEKTVLPVANTPAQPPPKRSWRKPVTAAVLTVLAAPFILQSLDASPFKLVPAHTSLEQHFNGHSQVNASPAALRAAATAALCDQAPPLMPSSVNAADLISGQKDQIVNWLSGAVKVPTEIFDVMGPVGEDERWEVFYKFAEYLEQAFPLVHEHLSRTRVMEHALLFEWEGSDTSLKPTLITAHQDVVPVLPATRGQWTHDPYGGEFDGERIWGRGSMDDKSGLIGSMSAIELMLKSGFKPRRTVILALGCDEETGGKGAYNLGQELEKKYGKDSMAILVDEGSGMTEIYGQVFAAPAVAEKGYLDVDMQVHTKGGHSSIPPEHTGIGLMSLLLAELERNPHTPDLRAESPLIGTASCASRFSSATPDSLRKALKALAKSMAKGKVDKKALRKIQDWWVGDGMGGLHGQGKAFVSTTQAIDVINGGVKVNALPEVVTAVINHRIATSSNVEALQHRIVKVLSPMAKKLNLKLEAFGKEVNLSDCPRGHSANHTYAGTVILANAFGSALNPAPISPYTSSDAAWRLLSGSVKGTWNSRPEHAKTIYGAGADQEEIYMTPSMTTGNTDTKRYWNLTRNIYRFAYLMFGGDFNHAHTVDEYINADVFVEQVRWFINFIAVVDETNEEL